MIASTRLVGSSNLSPPDQASQGNIASTPQPHSPAETWPLYTTYRQVSHYHPDSPTVHLLQHHVHHRKTRNDFTITGQVLHHKLPRPPTSTLPLAPGNALAPVTPAVAKYNIQHHSNIPTRDLQWPLCTLPHLRRLPRPQLLLHLCFQVSLTFLGERKKPSHLTGLPLFSFSLLTFLPNRMSPCFPQPFDRTVSS